MPTAMAMGIPMTMARKKTPKRMKVVMI